MTWLDGPGDVPPRVAFAVGKRSGGAVQRNRIRRRLRAMLADPRIDLRPGSWLVTAGPGAVDLPTEQLRAAVGAAVAGATGPRR